jgi:predicted transposase YdaD
MLIVISILKRTIMNTSLQTLLLEGAENRGYEKGYRDGRANSRTEGRNQGLEIAKRRIVKALRQENIPLSIINKITANLSCK